eukprot:Lithocolla_globosa_v1_NODE_4851_length_1350_cov_671.824074.p2 type:complete len:131 gc:universal NODE_4851_length_1350_cov_671.824074:908-1300(+)
MFQIFLVKFSIKTQNVTRIRREDMRTNLFRKTCHTDIGVVSIVCMAHVFDGLNNTTIQSAFVGCSGLEQDRQTGYGAGVVTHKPFHSVHLCFSIDCFQSKILCLGGGACLGSGFGCDTKRPTRSQQPRHL